MACQRDSPSEHLQKLEISGVLQGGNPTRQGTETFYWTNALPRLTTLSLNLANAVQRRLVALHLYDNRQVQLNDFTVLVNNPMPAVIGEPFFLTTRPLPNAPPGITVAMDPTQQQNLAEAYANAIDDYFRDIPAPN